MNRKTSFHIHLLLTLCCLMMMPQLRAESSSIPQPLMFGDYILLPDTTNHQWLFCIDSQEMDDSQWQNLMEEVQRDYPGWSITATSLPVIAINECEGETISRFEEARITIQLIDVRRQTQGQYYYTSTARTH